MDPAATLGIDPETWDAVEDQFQTATYDGREYRHLPDRRRGLERGTVLVGDTAVRGFPKTPRTLVLETGIPNHFDGPVVVEEKLNGNNTRVVDVDGLLAFTRGGYVCPYTTERLQDLYDLAPFFEAHPDLMLCGEVFGPESPYTSHDYPDVDSMAFRVFDVRERESGDPLPVEERRDLCSTHDVPLVPLLGVYDSRKAASEVRRHVRDLDERGREGVVMKTPDGRKLLKYTTSSANQGDLAYAFSLLFDYGQAFFFRRIIREAFQAVEWEEDDEAVSERARRLGEQILLPMVETIRTVQHGDPVGERHTVRGSDAAVEALLDHLRDQRIHLTIEADRHEEGERVVTFLKEARATIDRTDHYLEGGIVRE